MSNKKTRKSEQPKREVKPLYWKNPVFIDGKAVSGLVTTEDRASFLHNVKTRMPADEFENFKLSNWTSDRDLDGERKAEAIAKQKKNLGLS